MIILEDNEIELRIEKDNIQSKKTIEKLTDSLPEEMEEDILRYECQTIEKIKTNKK